MQEARAMWSAGECNAIALGQAEVRLAVAMHRCIATVVDRDRDHRAVGNRDRTVRERVRCDRHQRERGDLRRENGTACRQCVSGRPGRRRDDDAVGAHRVDEAAVDLDRAFDHRAERAAIHDDVVQRGRVLARAVGALDSGSEQGASFLDVSAVEHRAERRLHPGQRDVGQKSQAALVDTDQRDVVRGELARIRQHRAVASDDDCEIGGRPEASGRNRRNAGGRREARGVRLEDHRMSARGQEGGESRQRLRKLRAAGSPDQSDAGEACGRGHGHGSD